MSRDGAVQSEQRKNRRLYPGVMDRDYLHLSALRESIRPFAESCRGALLDFGCGNKPYRELFKNVATYQGVDVAVTDTSDLLLQPDGLLPCSKDSFDVVVSFQVLEHVPSPDSFLDECLRVLRPGGKILLTTHGIWPYHPGPHNDDFMRWTGAGLELLFTRHGFSEVAVSGSCCGYLSLIQQLLVLHDQARTKHSFIFHKVSSTYSLLFNIAAILLNRIFPKAMQKGDILPICYVVTARKHCVS